MRACIVDAGHGKHGMTFTRWRDGDVEPFTVGVTVDAASTTWQPAYDRGDNTGLVATDSMRNFVAARIACFTGSSVFAFARDVATSFLETYDHVDRVQVTTADAGDITTYLGSGCDVPLHVVRTGDRRLAEVVAQRVGDAIVVTDHRVAHEGVVLLRPRGNAFAGFLRDEFTRLSDADDRPLQIVLDVSWRLGDVDSAWEPSRDELLGVVLGATAPLASASIQHLLHVIGVRFLERFAATGSVALRAENRSPVVWPVETPGVLVVTEPPVPYGVITVSMRREAA